MSDRIRRLCNAVEQRRTQSSASSRTAKLLAGGRAKMAQKLGEEAVEVVIDAVAGRRDAVVRESVQRHGLKRPSDLRRQTLLHTDSRPDAWSQWIKRIGAKGINVATGPRFEHFYFLLEAAMLPSRRSRLWRRTASSAGLSPRSGSSPAAAPMHPKELGGAETIRTFRSWILNVSSDPTFSVPSAPVAGEPKLE
jgi:phosphoribosyl-ATP pyrophosphohydrolase